MNKCCICNQEKENTCKILASKIPAFYKLDYMDDEKAFICDKCEADLLAKSNRSVSIKQTYGFYPDSIETIEQITPQSIKEQLDEYVIGQHDAKRILSVAVYNQLQKIKYKISTNQDLSLNKSNILLIGPTGSGKTYLVQTISKLFKIPYISISATQLTRRGWRGVNLDGLLTQLLLKSNYNYELAKYGIVFIDEIDKLGNMRTTIEGNLPNLDVQADLLTIFESSEVSFIDSNESYMRKNQQSLYSSTPNKIPNSFDTTNLLIICSGAFSKIQEKLEKKRNGATIGFNANVNKVKNENILKTITNQDIIDSGLMPELVGRLHLKCVLDKLDRHTYKDILFKSKDSVLRQYQEFFNLQNKQLSISPSAIDIIIDKAIEMNLGARSLTAIINKLIFNVLFDIGDKQFIKITPNMVKNIGEI